MTGARWLATAAAAAVGVLLTGAPAGAAPSSVSVTFTYPAADGTTMTSPASLSGTVQASSAVVNSIDISVRWTDTANRPPAPHPTQETTITPSARSSYASWSFTPRPAANGRYTATVVATTTQSGASTSDQTAASRSFVLDVAPATPTGVKAAADTTQRTAHITWAPNTEPDLIGYEVVRAGPGAADTGKVIAGVLVPQADYTDTDVATQPAGTYRYTIVAVRQGGDGSKADFSGQSPEADATFSTPPKNQAPASPTTQSPPRGPGVTPDHPGSTSAAAVLALPPPGHVPLSDYQALVSQAQASTVTTEPPDPGFANKLPYQPRTIHGVVQIPGGALESGSLGAADGSQALRRTAEFIAGALVLAVLALFGLVLKRAAEQTPVLEALPVEVSEPVVEPGPPAFGPSLMLTIVRPPAAAEPTPVER